MTHIVAREHDLLVRGAKPAGSGPSVHGVPADAFDELRKFMQTPVEGNKGQTEVLARSTLLGQQHALRLRQWVGVICTPQGTTLEILPKTHEPEHLQDGVTASRTMLFKMLAAGGSNYRAALPADLNAADMPLFEVVLRYALEVFKKAIRQGLPQTYQEVMEERLGLKGRLNIPQQVKQPHHRMHLLHVKYDEFLPDRPETRLARLAVERIARLTRRNDSKRLARELLHALEHVSPSRQVKQDFQSVKLERGYRHFAPALDVAKLVLYELNPLTAAGQSRATAVLFDMNRVYETYVAHLLRSQFPEWEVKTQVTGKALGKVLDKSVFRLRPDLLITAPEGVIVADTKWKRLDPDQIPAYGILNADAYQMLAYSEVFQKDQSTKTLWLIYPSVSGLPEHLPPMKLTGERTLRVVCLDLLKDPPVFTGIHEG